MLALVVALLADTTDEGKVGIVGHVVDAVVVKKSLVSSDVC